MARVIDHAHHEIHRGLGYVATDTATVNDAGTREVRIAVAATHEAHMTFEVSATLHTTIQFYEDTTKADVSGNRLTSINRNRDSSNTSNVTICHTPSGSGDGTILFTFAFGADSLGAAKPGFGGVEGSRGEFILKPGKVYLLKVTSGTDGNLISIILDWYEELE